jgi:hypothetical protein
MEQLVIEAREADVCICIDDGEPQTLIAVGVALANNKPVFVVGIPQNWHNHRLVRRFNDLAPKKRGGQSSSP